MRATALLSCWKDVDEEDDDGDKSEKEEKQDGMDEIEMYQPLGRHFVPGSPPVSFVVLY